MLFSYNLTMSEKNYIHCQDSMGEFIGRIKEIDTKLNMLVLFLYGKRDKEDEKWIGYNVLIKDQRWKEMYNNHLEDSLIIIPLNNKVKLTYYTEEEFMQEYFDVVLQG